MKTNIYSTNYYVTLELKFKNTAIRGLISVFMPKKEYVMFTHLCFIVHYYFDENLLPLGSLQSLEESMVAIGDFLYTVYRN